MLSALVRLSAAVVNNVNDPEALRVLLSIGPTETEGAAMGALKFLTDDGLFRGQSPAFFAFMTRLARQADAASPHN